MNCNIEVLNLQKNDVLKVTFQKGTDIHAAMDFLRQLKKIYPNNNIITDFKDFTEDITVLKNYYKEC